MRINVDYSNACFLSHFRETDIPNNKILLGFVDRHWPTLTTIREMTLLMRFRRIFTLFSSVMKRKTRNIFAWDLSYLCGNRTVNLQCNRKFTACTGILTEYRGNEIMSEIHDIPSIHFLFDFFFLLLLILRFVFSSSTAWLYLATYKNIKLQNIAYIVRWWDKRHLTE